MADAATLQRLVEIANRLIRRTDAGLATWQPTDQSDLFLWSGSNTSITIAKRRLTSGWDQVALAVLNAHGSEVESISLTGGTDQFVGDESIFETLERLWAIARRSAFNVDSVLDDVLRDLR